MDRRLIAGLGALGVLAAGLVAGAVIAGSQAKATLLAAPGHWQTQWPMVKVSAQSYERGLFSSTHSVTLQWACEAASGARAVTLKQHISHGPLPGLRHVGAAVIDTELILPEASRVRFAAQPGSPSGFTAHTEIGFTGHAVTQLRVPPFTLSREPGRQFVFQGLDAEWRDSGDALQYELSTPGLLFVSRDAGMAIEVKSGAARLQGHASGSGPVWLRAGRAEAELAAVELNASAPGAPGAAPFAASLRQAKMTGEGALEPALLAASARITALGSLNGMALDKVDLQASVKHLHAAHTERLVQRVIERAALGCDNLPGMSTQMLLASVQPELAAVLADNPGFALDRFVIEAGGQRGELSATAGVMGANATDATQNPSAIVAAKGQLRGRASVPLAWFQGSLARWGAAHAGGAGDDAASITLARMSNDGLVAVEGGVLRSQFSLDKGQWIVNGKALARAGTQ